MIKLKPCPFCGGIAKLNAPGYEHYSPCWCKCTQCGAEGPTKSSELEAGERWNERAQENEWISVKDRLPDAAGYECLVCAVNENYNQTHVFTAHTGYGEPGWWTGNVNYMSRPAESPRDTRLHPALKVTHWMPLPEAPKDGDGDAR